MSTFSKLLKAYRERDNYGMQELADELGVTRHIIYEWEHDGYHPRTLEEILHLATILQTSEKETDQLAIAAGFETQIKALRLRGGVKGDVKNLIFASTGDKPRIVLRDSLNNDALIVENGQYCLFYDKPISERGLLWRDLIEWWCEQPELASLSIELVERHLKERLEKSLGSPLEKLLFQTYFEEFQDDLGDDLPALIPQVYLHYDPYTFRELSKLSKDKYFPVQRMDFLMLFSNHIRVVLEVDGQLHYSQNDKPSPVLYAAMVAEDRRLKFAGYEVYRFGGSELHSRNEGKKTIVEFFRTLFRHHLSS